eukprot:3111746-Rhodomonas_salina.1
MGRVTDLWQSQEPAALARAASVFCWGSPDRVWSQCCIVSGTDGTCGGMLCLAPEFSCSNHFPALQDSDMAECYY